MGRATARFGRNVPIEHTFPKPEPGLQEPSPRLVSRELLTRDPFVPATSVNALVAAWLQFMIRDWFSHGRGDGSQTWTVRLEDDDPWPVKPMVIPKVPADPTRPPGGDDFAPTYVNTESHWWDASQLYGSSLEQQKLLRSGVDGKLHIRDDGLLPTPPDPQHDPSQVPGFWLGIGLMQVIFIREHNAICDRLRAEYPSWTDDEIFERARLVNAALIAKIHTVEWTPAVISHPTTAMALRVNWWGLAGEKLHNMLGRVSSSEVISGIPGSEVNHYGVPYSLTEEFVAVYRMHPLVPDDYPFRSAADDSTIRRGDLPRHLRSARAEGDGRDRDDGHPLHVRAAASGARVPAQLPALPAGVRAPRRQAPGSRRDGHPPHPRARRAAVQRVPPPAASEAGRDVRRPDRATPSGRRRSSGSTAATSRPST